MYVYEQQRDTLFTDAGQRILLGVRDQVRDMLATSGAVTMEKATKLPRGVGAADTWELMACVDRLVELGELREISQPCRGNDRVFVAVK